MLIFSRPFAIVSLACLALLLTLLRTLTSTAQPVGDRIGDSCRVITIDASREAREWVLYARPIVTDHPDPKPSLSPEATSQTTPSDPADSADPNRITLLFDQEQVALLNANQAGVDGDTHLWHEIEDSIGNRGYMLAIDPETQQSSLRECP